MNLSCYDANMNDEYMSTTEALKAVGVSRQGLHYMARQAGVAPVKVHARRVVWLKSDVARLVERRRENLRKAIMKALEQGGL